MVVESIRINMYDIVLDKLLLKFICVHDNSLNHIASILLFI